MVVMEAELAKVMSTGVVMDRTSPHVSADAFRRLSKFGKAMMMERMRTLSAADRKYRDDEREKERGRMRVMAPGAASAISALRGVEAATRARNVERRARAASEEREAAGVVHEKRYWPGVIGEYNSRKYLIPSDGNSWRYFFPTEIADKGKDEWEVYTALFSGDKESGGWVIEALEDLYPGPVRDTPNTRRDREGDSRYALLRISSYYARGATSEGVEFTKKLQNYNPRSESDFLEVITYPDGDTRTFSKAGTLIRHTVKIEGTAAQKNTTRDWLRELFRAMVATYRA